MNALHLNRAAWRNLSGLRLAGALLLPCSLLAAGGVSPEPEDPEARQYWSNRAPQRPEVPTPRRAERVFNGIDAFILHHLEQRGLEPAPLAPKRTVLRRLSLDLTGLPPTPAEVRRFVIDGSDRAYSREVERLLASTRFGERMAHLWLQAVHFDQLRWEGGEAAYRAFVIDAFNRNLSFDQFTREQLAGGGVADASPAAGARSARLFPPVVPGRCMAVNCRSGEGHGHESLKVRIVSEAWLGASLSCAQCHDHPYDPLGRDDYRRMAAFFAGTSHGEGDADDVGHGVPPGYPACLGGTGAGLARDLDDLARWLTSREQPRTARVFVNRLWREFFGRGISKVIEDLGGGGEWPAHPELLDWLAVEFMESGWDVKHMVTLMVESSTYRQSSIPAPSALERDPANRWLSSQSPRPLEVAGMRDNALHLGGLLKEEVGGGSFKPFNLVDLLGEWEPDAAREATGPADTHHRRALYLDPRFWVLLDQGGGDIETVDAGACPASKAPPVPLRRDPMSDPIYLESSRGFAQRLLEMEGSDADRIGHAFELATVRPIERGEMRSLQRLLKDQRRHYKEHPEEAMALLAVSRGTFKASLEPREWAAWIDVCRVILNLEETSTRY